jgi:hypothetical protein
MVNEDINIMSLCEETEELDVFATKAMQDIIQYRWDTYGKQFHLTGLFFTMTYIASVILYVIEAYIESDSEHQKKFLIFLNAGLVYPVVYECI